MPLTRYQIRNEYSLADPELYRAADKDDPEAVLEGVAMAGLVGVLRQLGDLAEFAAQIFHDLHEEVTATAARGHGLLLRIQQLDAEVPSIEKAFLAQTSHSLFLLNAGVDWHPNLRMDENLITREDLPRCVMDSYEECQGPPRLFLLDKFDVSGAGACLKRYSDPSFFKAKSTFSETMGADIQREKKARKVKKKGSRWRNGENPEFYPTSHAKLRQLLSEERNSNNNVLMHHVKLKKRQLNGFSSESTAGKSYMERFVETHSPERSCENSLVPPKLNMESSNTCEQGLEIHEISTASPASKLLEREIGLISSAERQETALEQSMYDLHEDVINEGILEKLHEPLCDIEVEKLPSSLYKLDDQKKLVVDVESQKEVDGYQSDDITSEVDNYMDALATIESEMETDTDGRPNNDRGFINIQRLGMDPDTKELQKHQDRFSDSIGNSSESGKYNLFKKGSYGPSNMDTQSNLTVKGPTVRDAAAEVATSVHICPTEIVDVPSEKPSANDYTLESLEYVSPGGSCIEVSEIPSSGSELVEASPDSCVTDSTSMTSHHLIPGANLNEFQLQGPDFVGCRGSSSSTEEYTENLVADVPCTINLSDSDSKMKDDTLCEESGKSQRVEVMDGLSHEVSSDALLHQSDISGPVVATNYDGGTFDTVFPNKCAEDAPTDNINRNSDSPHSIILATEEHLSFLEGQDVEVCSSTKKPECLQATTNINDLDDLKSDGIVETDNGIRTTRENPEYVPSALDIQQAHNFAKHDLSEMTEEVPPQVDLELGIGNSGVDTLYNDLEVSSNTRDGGVSDEPALEVGQLNPGDSVGKEASSPEFPSLHLTPDSAKTAPVTDNSLRMGSLRDTVHTEADTDSVTYGKLIGSSNCIKQLQECPLGSRDLGGLGGEAYAQLDNMESVRVHVEAGDEDTADCGCLNGSLSRNHLKLEDKCPASNGNVNDIENEVHSKLDNLTADADHTEADVADIADFPNRIGSSSKIQMKLHEECLSNAVSEQFKLETTEARNPEFIIGEDSQKEINQLAAASTNLDVQVYDSGSHGLSSSEFPYDVHVSLPVQHPPGHPHLMDITEIPKSSVEMDKNLQFPQQIQPSESAEDPICTSLSNQELRIPSEQARVLEASQLIVDSLDGERESPLLSNLLDEQTDSLKGKDQNCCPSFPSKISWFEETEPVKHRGPEGSSDGASEFSCGDLLKQSLDFPLVPTSQNMLTHEPTIEPLASSFPSFGILCGTAHEQSSKPQPLQGPNAAQANLEEPPLPPLPPLQWRVGKFQHSSLTAEGEMVQPSLNPFLPLGFTSLGGEIVQPLNPFLPLNSGEVMHQHGSEVSGEDIVHHDLNPFLSQLPAVVGDTNINEASQTSEVEEIQLPNLFLLLPATEDEKLEHDLLPLGEEKAQPSLNSFAPSPATEEDRPPSDTLQGESCDVQNLLDGTIKDEEPLNSFTPPIIKEEESLNSFAPSPATEENQPPSDTLQGESCIVQNLSEPEPTMNDGTIKDEEPLNSFTTPIRKEEESLNPFVPSSATEEDQPPSDTLLGESCDLQNLSDPEPNMNDGTIKDEPLNSYAPLIIKEESSLNSFAPPTIKEEPLNSFAPPNIKHVEHADDSLMLGEMSSNATSFPNGVGVPNGQPSEKQPRPRDPLIEAVASHDRSMLRKATERAHPKIEHKMDSMLEQIRSKSFNLRPAVRPMLTTRPSMQGPRTNLNVAAILEKANAIRQATAGSDEDDNDSWSDS